MKIRKRLASLFLAFAMILSLVAAGGWTLTASAAETAKEGMEFEIVGKKTADLMTNPGQYEVRITVPGVQTSDEYNEIIVMVDASLSQAGNFDNLKNLLINLGKEVLSDDASMRLTLMGFGLGPRRAGSFYSVAQLEQFLAGATQEDLLQERSATNCEVGFEYVNDYINNSSKLKKTYVIYTSDGGANLDETALDWSKWEDETVFDYYRTFTKEDVISYIVGTELEHIYAGNDPIPATFAMFPAEAANVVIAASSSGAGSDAHKAALDALNAKINADGAAYVTAVLKSIFQNSNYTWGSGYSAADVEKAFQTYFRTFIGQDVAAYDSYMDLFYAIFGDTGSKLLTNRYTRAAEASVALQQNSKVLGVYHVGYSGASSTWMNPDNGYYEGKDISKLTYVYNSNFASVTGDMLGLTNEIITMEYSDVTVHDPMSKWVILDESSIRIYDDATNTKLWENGSWLTDVKLTDEIPISVTTNEDGHREITWKIKDGPLLHTDRYSLRYVVDVDETVEGFEYGKEYPANDPTDFTYTDHNGDPNTVPIEVPNVEENQRPDEFEEGDYGIRIFKQVKDSGKAISEIQFDIYKVVPDEDEILGSVPTADDIAKYAVEANKVATLVTDGTGYAAAKLEMGTYLVVEQKSSKVVAPVDPFFVKLPMANPETGERMNIVDISPKNVPVEPVTPPPNPDIPTDPEPDKTGTFSIIKHDVSDSTKLLAGAQFQIMRLVKESETGETYTYNGADVTLIGVAGSDGETITLTTNEKGEATSPELPLGLYFLLETVAPDGYETAAEVIPVYAAAEGTVTLVMIPNAPAPTLPETGGMGTTMFYVIGAGLMLAAVILLVTKKRMGSTD